jgi:hypothetical protein
MEAYIDIDYREIFNQIKRLDVSLQYAACRKFLDLVRPYLCKYALKETGKYFFRVRAHIEQAKPYFFTNVEDLGYRTDFFNINKFGRCNCPFESVFYCSDHPLLALAEVSRMIWTENKHRIKYYTTSVWKMNGKLNLVPLLEHNEDANYNRELYAITQKCIKLIDEIEGYTKKAELKEFHAIMGREFARPFNTDNHIYHFSSAVANYLLTCKLNDNEKIDGLVYASCIGISEIRRLGLNYVFDPIIIGTGQMIEFAGAYRSKLERKKNGIHEINQHYCKQVHRATGRLRW